MKLGIVSDGQFSCRIAGYRTIYIYNVWKWNNISQWTTDIQIRWQGKDTQNCIDWNFSYWTTELFQDQLREVQGRSFLIKQMQFMLHTHTQTTTTKSFISSTWSKRHETKAFLSSNMYINKKRFLYYFQARETYLLSDFLLLFLDFLT